MDVSARITSKGQVTVPKVVRDALGLHEGDQIVFRLEGSKAVVARTPDLLELAGTIQVPTGNEGIPWTEIRARTRAARALRSL